MKLLNGKWPVPWWRQMDRWTEGQRDSSCSGLSTSPPSSWRSWVSGSLASEARAAPLTTDQLCMVTPCGCCLLLVSPPTLSQGKPLAGVIFANIWKVHLQCLFHWNSLWNSELRWLLQILSHLFQFSLNFTFVCSTFKKKHKHAINTTNGSVCSSTRWFGYVYGSPWFNLHKTELARFTAGTVDHLYVRLYLDSPYLIVIWIKLIF